MRYLSIFLTGFVSASLFFALTGWAAKESTEEINALLKDKQKELNLLKKKISRQDKLISSAGKKEAQLQGNLRKIDRQIKLKERNLDIYQSNLLVNKKKLAKLEKNLRTKGTIKQKLEVQIGKRLRQIYKEGPVSLLKVAFSSENVSDFLQGHKYMELIVQHDTNLMADYNNQFDGIKIEKQALQSVRAKLIRLEEDALGKQEELGRDRKDRKKLLKKIKKEKLRATRIRKEHQKDFDNSSALITKLLSKQVSGEGLNLLDKKGRLALPVKGKILNKFGRQKDRQYGSFIVHNGIDIKTRTGTPVHSIFNGKILYTGELDGYGKLVIIGHGEDYYSLYGHLDRIDIKPNQVVKTGDIIGLSGDTGSLVGETLYLEMRKKGEPIEPTSWFKTTRRK